jgi:asparagine synthase (glutamine-hydrolysing)
MSILAGAFSRRMDVRLDASWAAAIRAAISRNPSEKTEEFQDSFACLIKTDSGAFGSPAYHQEPSGTVSMLIGEPLLTSSEPGAGSNRSRDLKILHRAFDVRSLEALKSSQGTFAGVHYESSSHTLQFFADKLALRPLYYWTDDSWVFFATALRILEALPFVPKVMDVRAVTEITGFAFPLGERAPYVGMKTIKSAEIVSINPQRLTSQQYWRWDAIPVSRRLEPDLLRDVREQFTVAVRRRLRDDSTPLAFLSGGMDSRCLVAALKEETETVHTMNFSLPGTQDRVYGAEMARRLGTIHHQESMNIANPNFFHRVLEIALSLAHAKPHPVKRNLLIWSGDGGSVGLGYVYMTEKLVSLLRKQDLESAITQFLDGERKGIVSRLLQSRTLHAVSETFRRGMREEFLDINCEDLGRRIYFFLLLNDQRRHLARLPEDVDLNRFEFITPFFDGDFLSTVAGIPIDLGLRHRFYAKWLSYFPPAVSSVPWQVYPSHEPCPVPPLDGLVSQFDRAEVGMLHAHKRKQLLDGTHALLSSNEFPEPLLNRRYLKLAYLAYKWRLRDYSYVLDSALVYARHWKISQGKYSLST